MRAQKLEIDSLANAVVMNALELEQDPRFAEAEWFNFSVGVVQRICHEQPNLVETDALVQVFSNYFVLVEAGATEDVIEAVGSAIKSAINCGFFIATLEQKNSWKFENELPSPEAETLLSATRDALEREILREWRDPHTARVRTVALLFGYLVGRPDTSNAARSLSGSYGARWVFVSKE
jgi:hypothetical protein